MKNLNRLLLISTLASALSLTACSKKEHSHEDGEHEHPSHEEGHQEHGHGHGGGISVTHYTTEAELFVEYPPLILNTESAFAAHLTWLKDFSAVNQGQLLVSLTGGGHPEERVVATVSQTAGIFRPVMKPQYIGKRRLQLILTDGTQQSVHDLGEVEVYPDAKTATEHQAVAEEESGLIAFTKEQQWKIDFATAPAVTRAMRDSVSAIGVIKPRAAGQAIVTAISTGIIKSATNDFPHLGQKVLAGQTLAYLSPRLGGDADLAALSLAIEQASITLDQASYERKRLESLLTLEAVAEKRVIEARQQERLAQANLTAARKRLATYQGGEGGIALKTPISGTVVAVNTTAGASVEAGQSLLQIADLDKVWLEAKIPESELSRIQTLTGGFFSLNSLSQAIALEIGKNARLVAYGGLVDANTRTVPAILEFSNPQQQLRLGMTVNTQLYTGVAQNLVAVPASALSDENGQSVLFVLKEGESFERRVVKASIRDGDWVGISQGLIAGERVVTRGAYQVRLAATAPAAMGHGHAH
ncbi:efflux RND transporter periplasmic adaptor subunit [Agitococcus lubricus]|uniref:RND family efflux transporter MFP subunit n=1 Tax=Agitococcus lubricus TaxID=1077255 RepID=A0A2T5J016_9GAMM|nr:efflux RND transporter periplasmic adaptor subunit [Agitococcus lubricus]PTQ89635.1 RND family efflux transporter MFP subunit [Agitococcus lubricus]